MTRDLAIQDTTALHNKLNDARDWVQLHGEDNWFIGGVLGTIGDFLNWAVTQLQELISIPAFAAAGARDRMGRRDRDRGLADLCRRRAAVDDPGHALVPVLRHRRPVARQHGHADHHRAVRAVLRC